MGELVERCRKVIKKLEKKAQSSDARLEDFLAAIQASPNGVVLLDSSGRIEWSNLTAANHLGFDPQRDLGQYVRNLVRNPAFTAYLAGAISATRSRSTGLAHGRRSPPRFRCRSTPMARSAS